MTFPPRPVEEIRSSVELTLSHRPIATRSRRFCALLLLSALLPTALLSACGRMSRAGEDSLKRQVDRFWSCRMEGAYEPIFDEILDAATRKRFDDDRSTFARSKGEIIYHWYMIEQITVNGSVGTSKVRYRWSGTKPASVWEGAPPKEAVAVDEWILENGRWHRKTPKSPFHDQLGELSR